MSSSVRLFDPTDVESLSLAGKRVAVVGFGSQGHAHALNLSDSGVSVVMGLRPEGASAAAAASAGLEVLPIPDAVRQADIVSVLIPDTPQPQVYRQQITPNLRDGAALLFAHGFNIQYDQIRPSPAVDVIMVAPKAPGSLMRTEFQRGRGVPALLAVYQDATGDALSLALAYADAIGCMRAGVLETTFQAETETDLFGEQAVLCGGVTALIKADSTLWSRPGTRKSWPTSNACTNSS